MKSRKVEKSKSPNAETSRRQNAGESIRHCASVSVVSAALGLLLAVSGCMQPVEPGVTTTLSASRSGSIEREPPVESNIVRVTKFFSAEPWLSFASDGSSRVNGFKCSVFLEGPGKARGVFGSGTLVVCMYRVDRDGAGREVAVPLQEWELPPDSAYPWRCKKPTLMGWGYGLRLQWREDLALEGKQIAIVVKYARDDGKTLSSTRQILRVPQGGAPVLTVQQKPSAKDSANGKPAVAGR